MIKVSVLYANSDGAKFDMDYYCSKHMPMVQSRMGAACKGMSVDQGLGGASPGMQAPFAAIGHLLFESVEAFQAAFGPHMAEIIADIPNYTPIQPAIQISEVKM